MQRILPALRVLLFSLITMALASTIGCGLKGDLVLPEQAGPTPSSEDPPKEAEEEADDSGSGGDEQARQ